VGAWINGYTNPSERRLAVRLAQKVSRACAEFDQFQHSLRDQSPLLAREDATPQAARDYWRAHVASGPDFSPLQENLVVLLLDTTGHIFAHRLIGLGGVDMVGCHAREVYRPAIVAGASVVVLAHNHPSGNFLPSADDIATTRSLVRAGAHLGIELADHIILGEPRRVGKAFKDFASLRELGYIYER